MASKRRRPSRRDPPELTTAQFNIVERIWDELDDGDVSTETLFALTCERASEVIGRDVDNGDVATALDPMRKR